LTRLPKKKGSTSLNINIDEINESEKIQRNSVAIKPDEVKVEIEEHK
jgi:hypothetical protein